LNITFISDRTNVCESSP